MNHLASNSPEFTRSLASASESLRRGQSHESRSEFPAALACYDETIALLDALPSAPEAQRALAIAWMNRGNALQKCHVLRDTSLGEVVSAYDTALTLLAPLVDAAPADHALRNSLGAAYLNRAGALLAADAPAPAVDSADRAIATLATLPLGENIFYRVNLAGAHLNRASALLSVDLVAARVSAGAALELTATAAHNHLAAAHAALGARRTLLAILGRELSASPKNDPARRLAEAGDLIDDGLALARTWDTRRIATFRPAAAQLLYAGAILYSSHQPHFLAEFLEENQSLAQELPAVVQTMLTRARRTAHERCLVAGATEPLSRTFDTLTHLSAIAERLAALGSLAAPLPA